MSALGDAKDKVAGNAVVRLELTDLALTEEKLAALSAEIKDITDKGATVRVNMSGSTRDLEAATAQSEALSASGARVSTVLEDEGEHAETFGSKMKNSLSNLGFTPWMVGMAAIGGSLYFSIKQAGDFQREINLLSTDAGESAGNLKMVGDGIKGIAMKTGESLSQLTSGAFMIESAGYHGAAALTVLSAAAEGAVASGADLHDEGNAVTTVMSDFKLKTDQATNAASGLNAIVAHGKTTLGDLTASASRFLPTASALHVSFGDIGGAMATMTSEGISAKMAAMGLNSAMISLAAPNAVQVAKMNELGMSMHDAAQYAKDLADGNTKAAKALMSTQSTATSVANTLTHQGLIAAMQQVAQLALKAGPEGSAAYVQALNAMTGGHRGLQVALALTGEHMKTSFADAKMVGTAFNGAGKDVSGWALAQTGFNVKMDRFKEVIQVGAVTLGQLLIPALTTVLGFILKLVLGFGNLAGPVKLAIVALVGLGIGVMVFGAITGAVKAFGLALKAAVTDNWVGLLITALVLAAILIVTHWKQVSAFFDKFRHDTAAVFDGVRSDTEHYWDLIWANTITRLTKGFHDTAVIYDQIQRDIENYWNSIWNNTIARIERGLHDASALFDSLRHNIAVIWNGLWNDTIGTLIRAFSTIMGRVSGGISTIIRAFSGAGTWLVNFGANMVTGLWNGMWSIASGAFNWVKAHIYQPIVNAIKNLFGISSPSKVMATMGGHLMSGLILGLLKSNPTAMIKNIFGSLPAALGSLVEKGLISLANLPAKAMSALSGLGSKLLSFLGIGGKGGAANVAGWLDAALSLTGHPLSWLDPLEILVSKESSGNPTAVDPISVDGEHATGLLQMLPTTFAAYAVPGYGSILNPLDNAMASIRYISAVYGSPMNIPGLEGGHYVGYDQGGFLMPGFHMVANLTGRPERVTPAGAAGLGIGGDTYIIQVQGDTDPDGAARRIHEQLRTYKRHHGNQSLGL